MLEIGSKMWTRLVETIYETDPHCGQSGQGYLCRAGLMKPFEGRKTFVPIVYPPGPGAGCRERGEMVIQPAERSAMDPLCLQQNGRILGESNIIFAFPSVKVRQISNIRDIPKIAQISYIFQVCVCLPHKFSVKSQKIRYWVLEPSLRYGV